MAVVADAKNLQIDATCSFDLCLVGSAIALNVFLLPLAIGQVHISRVYIDMVEQRAVHKGPIALHGFALQRIVFVKVERHYVFKAKAFFAVHANQLFVQANGCATGSKAQNAWPAFCFAGLDGGGYLLGHKHRTRFWGGENLNGNFFVSGNHVLKCLVYSLHGVKVAEIGFMRQI